MTSHLPVLEIVRHLRDEPMFHLSLHSRELFHSNFLAWLFEAHPEVSTSVLEAWVPKGGDSSSWVLRERRQFDLVVKAPNLQPVAIENKVLALPNEEQLDGYARKVDQGQHPVLLSLHDPGWLDGRYRSSNGCEWLHVSYSDLVDELERHAGAITDKFEHDLVVHYCRLVRLLVQLMADLEFSDLTHPVLLQPEVADVLRESRLFHGVSKMRFERAAQVINERVVATGTPLVGTGFSRSTPLLEQFVDLPNGDRIGWQYQGDQWRLAVITARHNGKSPELRLRRERYVSDTYGGWFDFGPVENFGSHNNASAHASDSFNGYSPAFVYRYRKVRRLSGQDVANLAAHYMKQAHSDLGG